MFATITLAALLALPVPCDAQANQPAQVGGPIRRDIDLIVDAGDRWVAKVDARIVEIEKRAEELEARAAAALQEIKSKLTWAFSTLVAAIFGHRPASDALSWAVSKKEKS